MNAVHLLDRLLDPIAEAFSPEVARRIVDLRADSDMQCRLDELATRSTAGQLTAEERLEYEQYVDVVDLISVLQAKAQRVLDAAK
jgi:hypothetical protein